MLAWALWACTSSGGVDDSAPPLVSLDDPTLAELSWSCSAEEDLWTFDASATAWTAGATLALSVDGAYVEQHGLASVASAADGSWDRLALALDVVADPRDQARDRSTALLCDAATRDGLALRLALLTPDTQDEADCHVAGAERDWEALGFDPCGSRWDGG